MDCLATPERLAEMFKNNQMKQSGNEMIPKKKYCTKAFTANLLDQSS